MVFSISFLLFLKYIGGYDLASTLLRGLGLTFETDIWRKARSCYPYHRPAIELILFPFMNDRNRATDEYYGEIPEDDGCWFFFSGSPLFDGV